MKGGGIKPQGGKPRHAITGQGVRPGSRGVIRGGQKSMMSLGKDKFHGGHPSHSVIITGGSHV